MNGTYGYYWSDLMQTDKYSASGWDFDSGWAVTDATPRSRARSIRPRQR